MSRLAQQPRQRPALAPHSLFGRPAAQSQMTALSLLRCILREVPPRPMGLLATLLPLTAAGPLTTVACLYVFVGAVEALVIVYIVYIGSLSELRGSTGVGLCGAVVELG